MSSDDTRSQSETPPGDVTIALQALRGGEVDAMDGLMPLVYEKLHELAHRQLQLEPAGHTLSTTALVHEAYLKLADQARAQWKNRGQFFGVAAQMMRRILVDYARRHRALRRGGAQQALSLDELEGDALVAAQRADELVAVDEALQRLATIDERLSRVVECRFFAGLTEEETAEVLGVTARTVARDWVKARGWLYRELHKDDA